MRAFAFHPMYQRAIIIFLVGTLAATVAVAQLRLHGASGSSPAASRTDSTVLHVRLPEVVVSATRTRIPVDESPSAVTVVGRNELDRSPGQRLSSILQGLPGLAVRDLGGLHSIKTLSSRGTASVHTLFLVNGLRLNAPQNGLVDLGLLTGEAFEQIEIVRGGQSGLYGADAVGGLVNLVPRRSSDSLSMGVTAETGSFGLWAGRANASWSMGELSIAGGLGYEESAGDFRFVGSVNGQERVLKREGADSQFGTGFLHLLFPLTSHTSVSVFTNVSQATRGSPGPYTGSVARTARLEDRNIQTSGQMVASLESLGSLSVSGGYQHSSQHFVDLTLSPGIDERYENSSIAFAAQWDVPISSSVLGVVVADATEDRVEARQIDGGPGRTRWGLSTGMEIFSRVLAPLLPRMSIYPTVRYDQFSDLGGRWSPRCGFNLWLRDDGAVKLRASAGTSYRVPNFNELYWIDGGNPALKPETALSWDAGMAIAFDAAGRQLVDFGGFWISMRDRVTGWPPVNLSRSILTGLEMMWRWSLTPDGVYSMVTMTMTRAINGSEAYEGTQLPYVPLLEARAVIGGRFGNLRGEMAILSMSRRYTTLDNALALSSDPFAVFSMWLEYAFPLMEAHVCARVDVDNVLNADYEIVTPYPMPLRTVRLGLRFDL